MDLERLKRMTYHGRPLGESESDFGELRRSDDILGDREALQARMEEDGYVYLPGLLNRADVAAARETICRRLADRGAIDAGRPLTDAVYREGGRIGSMADFTRDNPTMRALLYDGPMMDFYRCFLGGPVIHFDYTWFRAKAPGAGAPTAPHYDVVYMGRGTRELYTSWTPVGDVSLEMGGLILLEGSHRNAELVGTYGQTDVDRYCENEGDGARLVAAAKAEGRELTPDELRRITFQGSGAYGADAVEVRRELGGRWLTADYRAGDVLVFCMHLMHASADNHTDRVRISFDSRYQPAGTAQDERWIGDDPPAHGIRAKQGMIC